VYAGDLATHRVYLLDSSRTDGNSDAFYDHPQVSITGSTAVWSYVSCIKCGTPRQQLRSAVLAKSLPNSRIRVLARNRGRCQADWPNAWGNMVVFQREGPCFTRVGGSDVYLANLTTGRVRPLTTNHLASEPVTNGKLVAFKQGPGHKGSSRFSDGAIMLMNLRTRKVWPASLNLQLFMHGKYVPTCTFPPQPQPHRVEYCDDQPAIGSGAVAWDMGGGIIVARDLSTGREYLVTESSSQHSPSPLSQEAVSGHRIVWGDTVTKGNKVSNDVATALVP
jgi:hypothetical protein